MWKAQAVAVPCASPSPSAENNYRQQQQMLPINLKGEMEVVGTEMQCHKEKNNETGEAPENAAPFLPQKAAMWLQCLPPSAVTQMAANAVTVQSSQHIPQSHRRKETSSIA